MPSTFTFPRTVLKIGSTDLGPASVPDGDTTVTITVDRTVTSGLNSQTAATQVTLELFQSDDGGTTWMDLGSCGPVFGGTVLSKTGQTVTEADLFTGFWPGTGRLAKATVVVAGSNVAVAGTITTA